MKDVAEEVIKFSKWVESDLPQTSTPKQALFTEDTGKLFIDTTKNNKVYNIYLKGEHEI